LESIWAIVPNGKRYEIQYAKRLPRKFKKMVTRLLNHDPNNLMVCVSPGFHTMMESINKKKEV